VKRFAHIDARTVEEAVSHLARYGDGACAIAGGTDLLGKLKERILPRYPEAIVNLKTIPGLDFISEEDGVLRIGALTRLQDIADHPIIQSRYVALSQAAGRTASPNLREMGTLAGNICQDIRCWYYRGADNRFPCLKKGGGRCYAIDGDNRYHSIFGGTVEEGCYAVHPSDTAPALIALNASIQTSKRTLDAEDFFAVGVCKTTVLESDEIVTEIRVPAPVDGAKSAFQKLAPRKSIDFAIVNCAVRLTSSGGKAAAARVCLNAVHVKPRRAVEAEQSIVGATVNEEAAEAAGAAAVSSARPMTHNAYMVQIARTLVKRAILACA
jgi:xanthine dehydrogenase YagS FAD-binding subunit